jgi:hypothetical protein
MGWLFGRRVTVAERQMAAFAAGRQALGRAASRNRPTAA